MSEAENSSSVAELKDTSASSLSVASVLEKWRNTDPALIRSGYACKCGAHVSIGGTAGEQWLLAHIHDNHADAFDWKVAIKEVLTLAATDEHAALQKLSAIAEDMFGDE